MTDAELVEFATEFRESILDGSPSSWMCAAICWPLSTLLEMSGVPNRVIETDLGGMNHFWLKLADGRVLDPTADQFNRIGADKLPPVYLGERRLIHGADGALGRQDETVDDATRSAPARSEGIAHE